jgi:oligopeptide/dipeptide ABC transporter ATP-binding protein
VNTNQIILEVDNLKKYFPIRKGLFRRTVGYVKAVDDISFFIRQGETLGMVGESGCGKTTTGRCLLRLYEPTAGTIKFRTDQDLLEINSLTEHQMKAVRRQLQIIFQDPFSSLDPRMSVKDIISEPLLLQGIGTRKQQIDRVAEIMARVGLDAALMNRYPHEFSGGQRQRIGIARSLILQPRLIVCDEPVSALDVSVQAQVLNLLMELQDEFQLTYLFVAHDLSVVEYISDRIVVMYLGKIVEVAESDRIYQHPKHPYTEALLAAIPVADPRAHRQRKLLEGTVPNPANPPPGCHFHTRCLYARDVCGHEAPQLVAIPGEKDHYVSCHFYQELDLKGFVPVKSAGLLGVETDN